VASQRGVVLPNQNCFTPDDDSLALTQAGIEAEGVRGLALPLDVCSDESIERSHCAVLDAFGAIDILVNGAGSSVRHDVANHPDDLWQRMLDINVTGPYRTTRRCLPAMMERGWGRIVNFGSTAANVGYPMHGAYCAAKAALIGLTRTAALEGTPHGVTCNAINPGFVDTGSSHAASRLEMAIAGLDISVEDYRAQVAAGLPQKRYLTPEEVAALALFLCRPEADSITGEAITIAMGSQW
jgi:NAD(P)-dependent dehydrogenase (short-subunit alcohol dehydrogenase family)